MIQSTEALRNGGRGAESARTAAGWRPTTYRQRTWAIMQELLPAPVERALDFGAGDGWFTTEMIHASRAKTVVGVDVKLWPNRMRAPVLFDGSRLPFADRSFDLVYAIDVLHHCPKPEQALDEVLRCSSRYFLIKDHTYRDWLGWFGLCVLDEIGNRRFKVPTVHRYQHQWEWSEHLQSRGFTLERLVHPAPCHAGVLGSLTNGWQYVALWRRARTEER